MLGDAKLRPLSRLQLTSLGYMIQRGGAATHAEVLSHVSGGRPMAKGDGAKILALVLNYFPVVSVSVPKLGALFYDLHGLPAVSLTGEE